MTHIANRTHATNPFARATLTVEPWIQRNERTHTDLPVQVYKYQCGADRYAVMVWSKKTRKVVYTRTSV
jgi:hypothetical protein